MEISELTLKLIIILVPGALSSIIFEKLSIHKTWTPFQFVSKSILFGATSYILAQLLFNFNGEDSELNGFWDNLASEKIPFTVVIKASICSIILAVICIALDYYKVINKIGKCIKITSKYGEENLYTYFLNASNVQQVYIRDIENKITYHGYVDAYAETDNFVEITLYSVKVYEYITSEFMYDVDRIYLSRTKNNLIIEVPETLN